MMDRFIISQDYLHTKFSCPNCGKEKTVRTKEFLKTFGLSACSVQCKYELRKQQTLLDYLNVLSYISVHPGGTMVDISRVFGIPVQTMSRILLMYLDYGFVDRNGKKYYELSVDGEILLKEWKYI